MGHRVTVLAGTTKGLFLLRSDAPGAEWQIEGPLCDGWSINHTNADAGTGHIWAGGGNAWTGAGIWRSADDGASWTLAQLSDGEQHAWARSDPEVAAMFGIDTSAPPAPFSGRADAVWSIGRNGERLFAGVKPAALLASDDGGETWTELESLSNHPTRDSWNPGGAGLTLHTIVTDPADANRLWLGISAAGVFATEDGGTTWERRNRLSNAEAMPQGNHPAAPSGGETGHCVHNVVRATEAGDLLYQQNHHGVFRSPDGGRSWDDVTPGLPSTFGFPIAVHPQKPDTIWTLPLNGDSAGRYPPDASAAIWRSRNGGADWESCRSGLPQKHCYFTVLRQAMATDHRPQPGLYFGSNSGSVFASTDEGETWSEIASHLPTVLCVETMTAQ